MALKKFNQTTMRGLLSFIKFTNKHFHSIKRNQEAKLKSKKTISVSNKNITTGLIEQVEIPEKENAPEQLTEKKSEKVLDNGLNDWFTRQQMENSKRETGCGDRNTDVTTPTPKEIPNSLHNALVPVMEESVPIKKAQKKKIRKVPEPIMQLQVNQNGMSFGRPPSQSYPWPSYSDKMKQKDQPNPLKTLISKREFSTSSNRSKIDAQVKSVMEEWINNSPNNIFRIDQLHNISCLVPESINPSKEDPVQEMHKLEEIKRNESGKATNDSKNEMMNEWYKHTYRRYLNLNRLAKKAEEEKAAKTKKKPKDKEIITTYENEKYFNPKSKKKPKESLPRLVKKYEENIMEKVREVPEEIPEEIVVRMDDNKDLYKKKVLPSLKFEKCPVAKVRELKKVPMRRIKRTHYAGRIQVMESPEFDEDNERADDNMEVQKKKLPMIP